MKKIVIALGGNALGKTPEEQLRLVEKTSSTIVDLLEEGYEVVVGHGNGPQVGMVNLAFENSYKETGATPLMPFPECGAMTQGYIGYHLQQSLERTLRRRNIEKDVATVITQVEVSADDPAFSSPTKPIGSFYTKEEAEKIAEETHYVFKEDAGRGYRRVVASPKPVSIVELNVVKKLLESGVLVITVGGGGIPVVKAEGGYRGIAAVIDKDKACSRLAADLHADMLVILTAVDQVMVDFRKENERGLEEMSVEEASLYIEEGQFAPGSMLPKVEACIEYVQKTKGTALITSLDRAKEALQGKTGTRIHL